MTPDEPSFLNTPSEDMMKTKLINLGPDFAALVNESKLKTVTEIFASQIKAGDTSEFVVMIDGNTGQGRGDWRIVSKKVYGTVEEANAAVIETGKLFAKLGFATVE